MSQTVYRRRSRRFAMSIVVPFLNAGPWLEVTVPSLLGQSVPVELVFVNDGSTDDSGARLAVVLAAHQARITERRHQVRVVRLLSNQGRSAARNAGVDAASASLLGFVDADVALPSGWAARHIEAHTDESAVAIIPRRIPVGIDAREAFHRYLFAKEERLATHDGGYVLPWKQFVTAAVTMRRDAFEAVGGFDPAIRYGEDTDLGLRLGRAHPRGLRYSPESFAYHHDPDTLVRALSNFARFGQRDLPTLQQRHPTLRRDTASTGLRGTIARSLAKHVPSRLVRGMLPVLPSSLHTLGVRGLCLRALHSSA
ncbi:MAG: glycosyltransferase family 2 protein [Bacteroidota bacterium]